ncbi:DMT family transporter [Microbispora triticiradicis]|uniref:DMT family transporter n=1 Tax=Microbispora triticiradicis TaxID=2200763 RepID=UPI001AD6429E|nr:DMT family transporter [Microbispora triticiradicis]MBO4272814.1 EamA family transporter [Microbispora triticiradicis]
MSIEEPVARKTDAPAAWMAESGLVVVAAVFGLTFVVIQDAIENVPPWSFVALRFLLAAGVVAVPYAAQIGRLSRSGWGAGAGLGLLLVGGYAFQTIGLAYTTASNSGFITGLYIVFTPLMAALLLRQRVTRWSALCIATAALGLLLLSGYGGAFHPLGDALTLASSLCFALHIIAMDRAVRRFPTGALVAVQLGTCGTVALCFALIKEDFRLPGEWDAWGAIAFTGLAASAFAYFVQAYAQRRTSPTRVSVILGMEPVFAGVFGYWLAGDRLTPLGWAGAATMVLGVLLMDVKPPRVSLKWGLSIFTGRPQGFDIVFTRHGRGRAATRSAVPHTRTAGADGEWLPGPLEGPEGADAPGPSALLSEHRRTG